MIGAAALVAAALVPQPGERVQPAPEAPVQPGPVQAAPAAAGVVQVRGQASGMAGQVSLSAGGVLLKTSVDDPGRLVSWDRVRAVEGLPTPPELASFSEGLMRARTRLERGDVWLADRAIEPLYQRALESPEERLSGPSGLLLAECALRSALEREAAASATVAWLRWSVIDRQRARPGPEGRGVQWVGGTVALPPVLDAATGLCPQLPPLFARYGATNIGTLRVLTRSPHLARLSGEGSPVRGLASAYWLAARIAAGEIGEGEAVSLPAPSGDAEQLVVDMAAAQTAPGELMRAARSRLQRRLEQLGRDAETREAADDPDGAADRTWQRAWLHAAVGRSLLAEDQRSLRRQGMVELLYVPALDAQTQPGLAAAALLDVLEELRRDGEPSDAAAVAIIAELRSRFGVDPSAVPEPGPAPVAPAPVVPGSAPAHEPVPTKESP